MGRKPVPREIINLRVSPDEFAALAQAASEKGHSVPHEVRNRLAEYRTEGVDHALGDLAALITKRANDALAREFYAGVPAEPPAIRRLPANRELSVDGAYRADLLGAVRDGVGRVLTALGAKEPANKDLAVGISFDLAGRIKNPTGTEDVKELYPEAKTLARISEALGFKPGDDAVRQRKAMSGAIKEATKGSVK